MTGIIYLCADSAANHSSYRSSVSHRMTETAAENRPTLVVDEERLPPVRGIVPLQNKNGKPFSNTDVKRWLRLHRLAFGCEKVDLLADEESISRATMLLSAAAEMGLRISLRVDASFPPPDLRRLEAEGLLDVMLAPCGCSAAHLDAWMGACREAELSFRLQIQGPFELDFNVDAYAERLLSTPPAVVNIAAFDPFVARTGARNDKHSENTVAKMNELTSALAGRGVEVNLLRLPFCLVEEELWSHVVNDAQFFRDHQQYERESYELAERLFGLSPSMVSKLVLILLFYLH